MSDGKLGGTKLAGWSVRPTWSVAAVRRIALRADSVQNCDMARLLSLLFGLALVVIAVWHIAVPRWESRYSLRDHTWLLDRGDHPLWAPPPPVKLQDFAAAFGQSGPNSISGPVLNRPRWDWGITKIALW